jgi:hypothetical protein
MREELVKGVKFTPLESARYLRILVRLDRYARTFGEDFGLPLRRVDEKTIFHMQAIIHKTLYPKRKPKRKKNENKIP